MAESAAASRLAPHTKPHAGPLTNSAVQIALVVAMGGVWGAAFPANRYAMTHGLPPLGYTFWVFVVAVVVGGAVCALNGVRPRLTRWYVVFTLFTGVLRCAVPVTMIAISMQHISAGLMVMISSTSGIVIYGGAIALGRERFHWVRFLGVLCGLAGVACILVPQASLPDPDALLWVAFAFGVPVLFALTTLAVDYKRPPDTPTLVLTAGMFAWAAIALLPLALITDSFYVPNFPPRLVDGTMLLHGLINGIAFIGLFELIRIAGVVIASQTTYVTPLAGVAWGVVLLGERHSEWVWLALALIVGGLFLVNLIRRAAAPPR
jgi:drug/metabolite transporter (DMT)-like permease